MPKDKDVQANSSEDEAFLSASAGTAGGESVAGGYGPEDIPQTLITYLGDTQYDTSLMVEYLCLHRFPVLQVFDEKLYDQTEPPPGGFPGTLLDRYRAESGVTIYVYEHCIMIGTGELAYMDGNYTRMLRAMYEIFQTIVPERIAKQGWKSAAFIATHPKLENVAWVIAKMHNIPLNIMLETDEAEALYRLIAKNEPGKAWVNLSIMQKNPQAGS